MLVTFLVHLRVMNMWLNNILSYINEREHGVVDDLFGSAARTCVDNVLNWSIFIIISL